MKSVIIAGLMTVFLLAAGAPTGWTGEAAFNCDNYSDRFDLLDIRRWQEVLLYSDVQGEVAVEDGRLVLRAHPEAPSEIQVYSLFTLQGDFDIQIDYKVLHKGRKDRCRFNAGLVLQTAADEISYKCYVSKRPKKGSKAPDLNRIRVVRKNEKVFYYAFSEEGWQMQSAFQQPVRENLRIRLKLQTSGDSETTGGCPAIVAFDNFRVNACTTILDD